MTVECKAADKTDMEGQLADLILAPAVNSLCETMNSPEIKTCQMSNAVV